MLNNRVLHTSYFLPPVIYALFVFSVMQRYLHIAGHIRNHKPKSHIMKLPKTLLVAVLTGITLQTVQSCTKEKDDPSKEQKEKEKGKEGDEDKPKPPFPYG